MDHKIIDPPFRSIEPGIACRQSGGMFGIFLLAFIPIFVAMDVLGVLPLFLSITEGMSEERRRRLLNHASYTALVVGILFLFTGKAVFRFMGITVDDFRIGGGIVLLVLAVRDLIFSDEDSRNARDKSGEDVGVVPIGIPLIMGPAVLTTLLILVDSVGYTLTITSLVLNLTILWLVFRYSAVIVRIMGAAGAKGFAKIACLFLAAIAVMMIRQGVTNTLWHR